MNAIPMALVSMENVIVNRAMRVRHVRMIWTAPINATAMVFASMRNVFVIQALEGRIALLSSLALAIALLVECASKVFASVLEVSLVRIVLLLHKAPKQTNYGINFKVHKIWLNWTKILYKTKPQLNN